MIIKKIITSVFLIILISGCNNNSLQNRFEEEATGGIYVASWNLENLFDTSDDPLKNDEDFLPSGENEWTEERLKIKMENLARVIKYMNDGKGPDVLGVQEVENKNVLEELLKYLPDRSYKIGYLESPDNRGIDNGIIYDTDIFKLKGLSGDYVFLDDGYPTRLILRADLNFNNINLHFFINHFPSRRGGAEESEPDRIAAAETLRKSIDRIMCEDSSAKIIVMGDFNDEPENASIKKALGSKKFECENNSGSDFYNLSYKTYEDGLGSYMFRQDWNMLDQIIISEEMADKYICGTFKIEKPDFMITKTGYYSGSARPTFGGRKYLGGFSDHFPVSARFDF